jgi:hypothetical protein
VQDTTYAADWSVLYPDECDAHDVLVLLQDLLIKYWAWHLFLWRSAGFGLAS